jgi:hypothetical protein
VIDHWRSPEYVHDLVFQDLGRIIGLSETKYLYDKLMDDTFASRQAGEFNLSIVRDAATTMAADGLIPTALILPIELYRDVFTRWDPSGRLITYGPRESINLEGIRIRLLWSNNFVPLLTFTLFPNWFIPLSSSY